MSCYMKKYKRHEVYRMATIKRRCKRGWFSVCTVSRALAGKGYIKEETRQRIMEAVRTVDYRPNNLAVSLKDGLDQHAGADHTRCYEHVLSASGEVHRKICRIRALYGISVQFQ